MDEVMCSIAVLILSGYCTLPRRRMYWEGQSDSRCQLVADNIRCTVFEDFMSNVHVEDPENLPGGTKIGRVAAYFDELKIISNNTVCGKIVMTLTNVWWSISKVWLILEAIN